MRPFLIYTRQNLLLLIVLIFIGCGSKENYKNSSERQLESEETTASFNSNNNFDERISSIENKVDANLSNIKLITASLTDVKKIADELDTNPIKLFFLSIFINLIIVITACFFLLKRIPSNKKIKNLVLESKRLEGKFTELTNKIELTERNLIKIEKEKRLHEYEKKKSAPKTNKSHEIRNVAPNENKPMIDTTPKPIRYLSGIDENRFNIVDTSPNNSFFKILNEKEETAEFEFSGSAEEAIAKKVFNEHISKIISGSQKTAQSVKTTNPGEIKRIDNHWEVTKRIEVELS